MTNRKQVILIGGNAEYLGSVSDALRSTYVNGQLTMFSHGADLLTWLNNHPKPSLILLDAYMVDTKGIEILNTLKQLDAFRAIPVVMLTKPQRSEVIQNFYFKGANAYMVKPVHFQDLQDCMALLTHYWFDVVHTPGGIGQA